MKLLVEHHKGKSCKGENVSMCIHESKMIRFTYVTTYLDFEFLAENTNIKGYYKGHHILQSAVCTPIQKISSGRLWIGRSVAEFNHQVTNNSYFMFTEQ